MDEVILWQPDEGTPVVYDVSTEEKEEEAYRDLFSLFDQRGFFTFSTKREENELERLKNPRFENEDFIFVETRKTDYAEQIPKDEVDRKIEGLKSKIERTKEREEELEDARDGNYESIRKLVRIVKRRAYVNLQKVKVENGS